MNNTTRKSFAAKTVMRHTSTWLCLARASNRPLHCPEHPFEQRPGGVCRLRDAGRHLSKPDRDQPGHSRDSGGYDPRTVKGRPAILLPPLLPASRRWQVQRRSRPLLALATVGRFGQFLVFHGGPTSGPPWPRPGWRSPPAPPSRGPLWATSPGRGSRYSPSR